MPNFTNDSDHTIYISNLSVAPGETVELSNAMYDRWVLGLSPTSMEITNVSVTNSAMNVTTAPCRFYKKYESSHVSTLTDEEFDIAEDIKSAYSVTSAQIREVWVYMEATGKEAGDVVGSIKLVNENGVTGDKIDVDQYESKSVGNFNAQKILVTTLFPNTYIEVYAAGS